jgi:biofilm PGA synthesis N-glycosyltransferase PgaC
VKVANLSTIPAYVLITPARNEARFIELTIQSMVAQTVRPLLWVIVSDGSTDGTDEIVGRYIVDHDWIELIRMPARTERNFAGKVHAFNAGRSRVSELPYEVIGNLDADVSFGAEHFQRLVGKFAGNPRLGVVGAPFREGTSQYDYRFTNIENVWGGCQLFRKECFEDFGGYVAVKGGCIDHIAVVSARIKGWQTRTFTETVCVHHRTMGTAQNGGLTAKFRMGVKDYSVGNHLVWEMFRAVYQMKERPFGLGGVVLLSGYLWSMVRRVKRPVSTELVVFTRREQMRRLSALFGRKTVTRAAGTTLGAHERS